MKKTILSIAVIAAAIFAASCQKENLLENNASEGASVFTPPTTTTGTAKATIDGKQVDVNWVQLWADGPKFADRNVGASSATDVGSRMTFMEAKKTGSDYVWGANWCTPSKDQMDELRKAAASKGSEKVNCEIVREGNVETGNIIGFKFTGKETGYTGNSVFFPAEVGNSGLGVAEYWSATAAHGIEAWYMDLDYFNGRWYSDWKSYYQDHGCPVRPVLTNIHP